MLCCLTTLFAGGLYLRRRTWWPAKVALGGVVVFASILVADHLARPAWSSDTASDFDHPPLCLGEKLIATLHGWPN